MIRMVTTAALAFASGSLGPGCVTQNVQFDIPRNFPPSIESAPTARYPINEIIDLRGETPGGDTGPGGNSVALDVVVRDPNLDQRLQYKVFLDYDPADPLGVRVIREGTIPPGSGETPISRPLTITLDRAIFGGTTCHRVELFVSTGFRPAPRNREPAEDGDLGTATWWVASGSGTVDIGSCP